LFDIAYLDGLLPTSFLQISRRMAADRDLWAQPSFLSLSVDFSFVFYQLRNIAAIPLLITFSRISTAIGYLAYCQASN